MVTRMTLSELQKELSLTDEEIIDIGTNQMGLSISDTLLMLSVEKGMGGDVLPLINNKLSQPITSPNRNNKYYLRYKNK